MLDFYEVWKKEIIKKRIAIGISIVLFFISTITILSAFIFVGEEKTIKDYAFVYVVERFSYTPYDVEKAYFSRYQYKPVGYKLIVEDEINEIKELRLVSFFKPESIRVNEAEKKVIVVGTRIMGKLSSSNIVNVRIKKVRIVLSYNNKGFTVEKVTSL